jgi:hypothetical protein
MELGCYLGRDHFGLAENSIPDLCYSTPFGRGDDVVLWEEGEMIPEGHIFIYMYDHGKLYKDV